MIVPVFGFLVTNSLTHFETNPSFLDQLEHLKYCFYTHTFSRCAFIFQAGMSMCVFICCWYLTKPHKWGNARTQSVAIIQGEESC